MLAERAEERGAVGRSQAQAEAALILPGVHHIHDEVAANVATVAWPWRWSMLTRVAGAGRW